MSEHGAILAGGCFWGMQEPGGKAGSATSDPAA